MTMHMKQTHARPSFAAGTPGAGLRCWLCVATGLALSVLGVQGLDAARGQAPAVADDPVHHATALSKAFRDAAERATPSVVVVRSSAKPQKASRDGERPRGQRRRGENPFKGTPFEDMFPDGVPEGFDFNMPERAPRPSGVGSGVIVDPKGIVITNNHVVEDADEVVVELADGREFKATDIKTDPESDLAVLRLVDAADLPTAKLGDSDKLSIGDWVIAIGNPFELETTVSAGIISGKGREVGGIRRAQFLQTDAAINPGNSGGPLVNLAGEVIGINTAIASSSGGYQGIGFAIPANLVKWVTTQLIDKGKVERAFIGVQMGPLDAKMAARLGVKSRKGVLVNDVVPGSPAAEAGVQELDVITSFDGQAVTGTRGLQEIVERSTIGKPHTLTVFREGKEETLQIAVKPLPTDVALRGPQKQVPAEREDDETFYDERFGIEVSTKSASANEAYADVPGVLVARVDPDGIAAEQGLGPGVLIRAVGSTPVSTIDEFKAAIEKESPEKGAILKVRTPRGNSVVLLQKQ